MPRVPILLMVRELGLGGSERQITEVARFLDRGTFDVRVGCFIDQGLRSGELRAAGVPIERFEVSSYQSPRALSGAWTLARYIRAHNIQLVHAFDYPTSVFAVPVARALTRAAAAASQRSHRRLIPPVYRRLMRMTDHVMHATVVNCEYLRRHLIEDEHVRAEKIELCYNGVDTSVFCPSSAVKPAPLLDARLVIGVACGLRPEKGLSLLLDAFAQVRNLRPGARLVLIGSGSEHEALQSQSRRLGIADVTIFQPAIPYVADWVRAIDIFVLPSLTEAFSNALMEAMACGCCAVASSAGGNPELVTHERTGLLFEPGNLAQLASALRRLFQDEAYRKQLAERGLQLMRERFSARQSAQRMGEIYLKLTGRR